MTIQQKLLHFDLAFDIVWNWQFHYNWIRWTQNWFTQRHTEIPDAEWLAWLDSGGEAGAIFEPNHLQREITKDRYSEWRQTSIPGILIPCCVISLYYFAQSANLSVQTNSIVLREN